MALTPTPPPPPSAPPPPRPSLITRLSAAALTPSTVAHQLPGNYISLARSLISASRIAIPEAEEVDSTSSTSTAAMDFFENISPPNGASTGNNSSSSSSSGTPPPNYSTAPPTPRPSFSHPKRPAFPSSSRRPSSPSSLSRQELPLSRPTSLTEVVRSPSTTTTTTAAESQCSSCSHLQLQLHLLSLQNEAYLAQRDYLLHQHHQDQQQPLKPSQAGPPSPAPSPSPSASAGLLSFLIATAIRAAFLIAFVLWPYFKQLFGHVREWERQWGVGCRLWSGAVLAWGVLLTAGQENGFGGRRSRMRGSSSGDGDDVAGWEVVVRKGVEEIVAGVGAGVREGLGVWGVKLEV